MNLSRIAAMLAVGLFAEDWEIFADGVPVYGATCNLMHPIICFTLRCAPPYSQTLIASDFILPQLLANP